MFLSTPNLFYDRTEQRRVAYPPDTKAFLYYTVPSERPRIAGELRLRVTSSDDPASFASGSDLLQINGQPWSRPLIVIKIFLSHYAKLREDGLVPDNLDSILSSFPEKWLRHSSQILYTLNDTFIINFSRHVQFLSVITEQGMETLGFHFIFLDSRVLVRRTPYTGAYTNHCSQIDNSDASIGSAPWFDLNVQHFQRTFVLRFLKIITPVKCVMPLYDGYVKCPKEGELFQRGTKSFASASVERWYWPAKRGAK